MVYPHTSGLPAVVEIAPGAQLRDDPGTWPWVDVTGDWRQRDGITIEEGRGDWGQRVDAGSCSLTFDNTAGHYSQHNPAGQWYGKLGRDTPLRVRIRRGVDDFGRSVGVGGWGVSDSGQPWAVATGTPGNFFVQAGAARHSLFSVSSSQIAVLAVDLVDVTIETTVTVPVLAAGAAITTGLVARWRGNGDNYLCELHAEPGGAVRLQLGRNAGGVFATVAGPVAVPGLTHAAGKAYGLEWRVAGDQLQARAWDAAGAKPAVWHIEATDTAVTAPGQVGCRSRLAFGNTNALPVTVAYGSFSVLVDLFGGYVPAWVPRWGDKAAADRHVPVTARGTLYRLQPGTGQPAKRSTLRRACSRALAYWPAEDGAGATFAGSAVAGHEPLTVIGGSLSFAEAGSISSDGSRWGTDRIADLGGGARLVANVPPDVTAATAAGWSVTVAAEVRELHTWDADRIVLAEVHTPGGTPFVRWQLIADISGGASGESVIAYDANGAATAVIPPDGGIITSFATWDLSVWQSAPGTISVGIFWFGEWETLTTVAGTLGGVTRVAVNPTGTKTTAGLPAGHIAVWDQWPAPIGAQWPDGFSSSPGGHNAAYQAYLAEPAHLRVARLCREDGIPLLIPAVDQDGAVRMGRQPIGAPLELYRQAEDVDGGVLYERPFSLAYQPRTARYNQTPALTLSFAGDLSNPPAPDPDAQTYRNRVTVNRVDGTSATVETPGVTAGVELVHDESLDLPAYHDHIVPHLAGWRLHLGAYDALRWPRLDLDLAARPDLIDAWLNCRVGSRILVANPMADVAGQDVDVLLEGHTTKLGFKDWEVAATCSPAAPWDVATVDGPRRIVANGSTVAGPLAAGGAQLLLSSTAANGPWTSDPAAFPLDVRVGGERVTASAIAALADTFSGRTVAAGWGSTSAGGLPWQVIANAANHSVSNGTGVHSCPAGVGAITELPDVDTSDLDVSVLLGISAAPVGGNIEQAVSGRLVAFDYVEAAIFRTPSNLTVAIRQFDAGVGTLLTAFVPVAGAGSATTVWLRFQLDGAAARVKVWPNGTTEPAGWTAEATVSRTARGTFRLRTGVPGSVTNGPFDLRYLEVSFGTTQTVALSARGLNGVQRAWPAGTPVDVWAPAIVAL